MDSSQHSVWRSRLLLESFRRWLSPGVHFEAASDARQCARCRYPFPGGAHGKPAPCSECGAWIDPAVPGTLVGERPSAAVRWPLIAPGAIYLACVTIACGCVLFAGSVPGGRVSAMIAGLMALGLLGIIGVLRLVVAFAFAWKLGRLRDTMRQPGWWLPPGMALTTLAMLALELPLFIGALWHLPTLRATAQAWNDGKLASLPSDLGGLDRDPGSDAGPDAAPVLRSTPMDLLIDLGSRPTASAPHEWFRGPVLFVPNTGFMFDRGAYVYLPNLPASVRRTHLRWVGGDWYAVRISDDF